MHKLYMNSPFVIQHSQLFKESEYIHSVSVQQQSQDDNKANIVGYLYYPVWYLAADEHFYQQE